MVVILTGMSCVGKDRVREELGREYNFTNIVSYTSRPIRENETDGIDYNFVSKEEFKRMIDNNEMIEYRSYNTLFNNISDTWYYGIKKEDLDIDKNYVVVLDLDGTERFIQHYHDTQNYLIIYLSASDSIRKRRAINRGSFDITEWNRRVIADKIDFSRDRRYSLQERYSLFEINNNKQGKRYIQDIAAFISNVCYMDNAGYFLSIGEI